MELIGSAEASVHKTTIENPTADKSSLAQVTSSNGEEAIVVDRRRAANGGLSELGPSPTSSSRALHYQDGTIVSPSNENERKAFAQYRKDNGEDPTSLDSLRSWYEQHKLT